MSKPIHTFDVFVPEVNLTHEPVVKQTKWGVLIDTPSAGYLFKKGYGQINIVPFEEMPERDVCFENGQLVKGEELTEKSDHHYAEMHNGEIWKII